MGNEEQIKQLLVDLKNDLRKALELEKYEMSDVINIGLNNGLYESLIILFQPIVIDGITKIYFDAFSATNVLGRSNIVDILNYSCDSKEKAEQWAKEEYDIIQKQNAEMSDEDREFWGEDNRTYEEILSLKLIIPKNIKDAFRKALFTIDFDLVGKIKVKDSHARDIGGVGFPIRSIEDVIFYAEPACLATCIDLYNKNILTTMNDTEGVIGDPPVENGICKVHCDYKSLSPENKAIFDELIADGVAKRIMDGTIDSGSLFVPCNREETIAEVSAKLQRISSRLKMQDVLYGKKTPEELYQEYRSLFVDGCFDNGISVEGIIKFYKNLDYANLIYDESENTIWASPEVYQKHKNYLNSLLSKGGIPKKIKKS